MTIEPNAKAPHGCDSATTAITLQDVLTAVDGAETVIAAAYVIPTAGRAVQANGVLQNSVALTDTNGDLLHKILDRAAPKTIVLAMGNPYLAMDFPQIENYVCAYSNATTSEVAAVKALFGEIPFHGRLPVTIPGVAQRGAGSDQAAQGLRGRAVARPDR